MPLTTFRDENIIVIHIGSYRTRAILGLSESLTPPTVKILTRVGIRRGQNNGVTGENTEEKYLVGAELCEALISDRNIEIIWPIKRGIVKNWKALEAIWSYILYKLLNRPYPPQPRTFVNPVYLIVPPQWNFRDKELATRIFFEEHLVAGFAIGNSSVLPLYAMGHLSGLVIHIGHEKTDITPILDAQAIAPARVTIPIGGKDITEYLYSLLLSSPPILKETNMPLLPEEITLELSEKIKYSNIVEVIVENVQDSFQKLLNRENDNLQLPDSSMDGVEDVASIVASGKTREYLAQKEAEKNQSKKGQKAENIVLDNKEMNYNQFTMDNNQVILVGKERFKLCDFFFNDVKDGRLDILNAVYIAINNPSIESNRRAELWENIAIVGEGSRITGFKERIFSDLTQKFVSVIENSSQKHHNLPIPTYTTPNTSSTLNPNSSYLVYHNPPIIFPSTIRLAKIPDFFPEWKPDRNPNAVLEEACFLGGEIVAKLSFNDPSSKNYMGRGEYNENGPPYINDI